MGGSRKKRAERLHKDIEDAQNALDRIGRRVDELLRRNEESAEIDGYPRGGVAGGSVSGGDRSDPTFQTVEAREADTSRDTVGEAVEFVMSTIVKAAKMLRSADTASERVIHSADSLRGRVSSLQGTCEACHRDVSGVDPDRLRGKLCPSCYVSWTGYQLRHPDYDDPAVRRQQFLVWRRANLEEIAAQDAARAAHAGGRTLQGAEVDFEVDEMRAAGFLPSGTES